MTTKFVICDHCQQLRIPAHMLGSRCVFCPKPGRPHLASPPLPSGYAVHPMIKPPADALDAMVRRVKEAR